MQFLFCEVVSKAVLSLSTHYLTLFKQLGQINADLSAKANADLSASCFFTDYMSLPVFKLTRKNEALGSISITSESERLHSLLETGSS